MRLPAGILGSLLTAHVLFHIRELFIFICNNSFFFSISNELLRVWKELKDWPGAHCGDFSGQLEAQLLNLFN